MREIKFRAWDKDNHIMYYSDECADNGEGDIYWVIDSDGVHFEEPKIIQEIVSEAEDLDEKVVYRTPNQVIMQFIGIPDSNGKEIYEADILESVEPFTGKPFRIVVRWDDKKMDYNLISNSNFFHETARVIGNVYEAPELAEAGK